MKQPFWKKWLSYLTEVPIEITSSEINEHLEVLYSKGEYQLCTEDAIYSYGKRYDNFFQAFEKIDIHDGHKKCLVLGLGLASIPWMLERHFRKDLSYTAVEIDEEIIHLASKYVLDEIKSEMTVVQADALHYVHTCNERFDIITMDIFLSAQIPQEFEAFGFLKELSTLLEEDGILLINRLYYFENDKRDTERYYHQKFKKVFPEGKELPILGNWILINDAKHIV